MKTNIMLNKNLIFICIDSFRYNIWHNILFNGTTGKTITDKKGIDGKIRVSNYALNNRDIDAFLFLQKNFTTFYNAYTAACSTAMSLFSVLTGKFPSIIRNYSGIQRFGYEYIDLIRNIQYETIANYFPDYNTFSWIESKYHFDLFRSYLGNKAISGYADKGISNEYLEYTEYMRNNNMQDLKYIDEYLDRPTKNIIFFHFFGMHFSFLKTNIDFRISCINEYLKIILNKFPIDRNDYIIFGDHGDAIADGNEDFGHVYIASDDVIRVPLMMKIDKMKYKDVYQNVSLSDIVPTILDYKNLSFKTDPIDIISGDSLYETIENNKQLNRNIYVRTLYPGQIYQGRNSKIVCISDDKKVIVENIKENEYQYTTNQDSKTIQTDKMAEDAISIDKKYKNIICNVYGDNIIDMWDNKKYKDIKIHKDKQYELFKLFDFKNTDNVLILGCGVNSINVRVADKVKNVVMVDWQNKVFDFYEEMNNVMFVNQKIEDYVLESKLEEYFDVILLDMVIHHLADNIEDVMNYNKIICILKLCGKLLKPDGKIIIGEGILPVDSEKIRKFYNKVFALKEIRHIFGKYDLYNILKKSGYDIVNERISSIEMSVNNWINNNNMADEVKRYIYNLHAGASDYIKQVYDMKGNNGELFINSKFMYIIGKKEGINNG